MIYIIHKSWSVWRIYKYIDIQIYRRQPASAASLLASWDTAVVWSHAIHNCVPVRIIHARDLSNSSITLTSKGHTRLFSRFRLLSNKIRPACVAPHAIDTEKKSYRLPTTRYRLKKWHTYFNEKSKRIWMMSYEYEYFGSARTPVTKSRKVVQETTSHPSLFCFIQDRSIPLSLQRWVSMKSSVSQLTFFYFTIVAREKPYTTARIFENE